MSPQVTQESTGWSQVPHWLLPKVKPMSVVVYAALARYAGLPDGARPAVKRVADDLKCSESTIERALRDLSAVGAVHIERRSEGGASLPSRYHLVLRRNAPPGVTDEATLASRMTDEEDLLSKKEKNTARERAEYDPEFEDWWAAYPSNKGKYEASKAYKRARKIKTAPDLLKAALAFGVEMKGTEPRFIPGGAPWLNQHRWDDQSGTSGSTQSDLEAWLRAMWQAGTAKPVEDRSRLRLPLEYQPADDTTPAREWQINRRRRWITDNRAAIIAAIQEREQ